MKDFESVPRTVAAYCAHCRAYRVLEVKGVYNSTPLHNGEYIEDYTEQTVLGACADCKQPVVVHKWFETYAPAESSGDYYPVYPKDKESARELLFDVPQQISVSYNEAVKCEKSEAWNACVVMVGRALEAAAKDYDPAIKSILPGITRMHDAGAISNELFDWMNELRILRNIGAHPTKADVEGSDAREALDFLQAILETIYHLRPMFRKRKERKKEHTT